MNRDQLADQNTQSETTTKPALPRREILRRAGVGAGILTLGGAVTAAPALARSGVFSVLKARPKVQLGWGGATCEAPLYAAHQKGFFTAEGLDVELVRAAPGYSTGELLIAGKIDGAPGILYTYLKPIEQGADLRMVGGLHGNCVRMVVAKNAGIKKASDFKGKSIGVTNPGDAGMGLFALLLKKNGVDPQRDVTWKVYAPTLFGAAMGRGEIQAVAAPDPFAYILVLQGKAIQVGNNVFGLFGNPAGLTVHKFCCTIALGGKLIRDQPRVAAAVTSAWLKGSHYTGGHVHEVSLIETTNKYVALQQPTVEKLLSSYTWIPSATLVQQDIVAGAHSYKQSGFLDADTNSDKLAQVAYANIFQLAGEPVPTF